MSGHPSRPPTGEPFDRGALAGANLAVDALASRVSTALRANGMPSILLRGAAIRALLHADGTPRLYDDVDLFVPPSQLDAAERIFRELGLVQRFAALGPGERDPHSREWVDPGRGIALDLHRTLVGVRADPAVLWTELSRESRALPLPSGAVTAPCAAVVAAVIALHAAQHGRRRPKPLGDLARALELLDDRVWPAAAEFAARVDALPAFATGLRLLPAGATLARRLELSDEVDVTTAIRARTARPTALAFAALAAATSWRERGAIVRRKLAPTPAFMRHAYPVARLRSGGLVLAYLWRPLVLLAHAGPGLLAWWRAASAAHRQR